MIQQSTSTPHISGSGKPSLRDGEKRNCIWSVLEDRADKIDLKTLSSQLYPEFISQQIPQGLEIIYLVSSCVYKRDKFKRLMLDKCIFTEVKCVSKSYRYCK